MSNVHRSAKEKAISDELALRRLHLRDAEFQRLAEVVHTEVGEHTRFLQQFAPLMISKTCIPTADASRCTQCHNRFRYRRCPVYTSLETKWPILLDLYQRRNEALEEQVKDLQQSLDICEGMLADHAHHGSAVN